MGSLWWPPWILGVLVLLQSRGCSGTSSHSVRYFLTAVSEPSQGLPQFFAVAYMDEQLMGAYDSHRRKIVFHLPWMQRMEREDPHLWATHMQMAQYEELSLKGRLATLQKLHNQSEGVHTWQFMFSCELSKDGRKGGRSQYAYDGRDFLAFDLETLTWTAASAKAEVTKRKWDHNLPRSQRQKVYLEETCIEWLQKYLELRKETLERREPPEVKVTRKDSHGGLETLLCQAHGFYPKEIDLTWRRDGEVRQGDTFHGVISPNADGTYYTWLSIEVDPTERSHYRCHVEHDGLQEPLDVTVKESASVPVWLIAVGIVLGVLVSLLLLAGIVLLTKKHQAKTAYRTASTSDQGSDSGSARA